MEPLTEHITPSPTYKIYKERAFWIGTFIGGPLMAGYLFASNYKAFNEPASARKAWIFSVLATIIIFGGVFLIPNPEKIPNQLIPLLYMGIASFLVQRYQGANIKTHAEQGGVFYGWGRIIGISLIALVITIGPILGIAYLTNPSFSYSKKTFGKLEHEILFNKNDITIAEVDTLGSALTKLGMFDEINKKSVLIKSEAPGTYLIVIPVLNEAWNNQDAINDFSQLRSFVQSYFPKKKIVVGLCADEIDQIKKRIE